MRKGFLDYHSEAPMSAESVRFASSMKSSDCPAEGSRLLREILLHSSIVEKTRGVLLWSFFCFLHFGGWYVARDFANSKQDSSLRTCDDNHA